MTIKAHQKLDWFCPQLGTTEEQSVTRVLRSGFINDGPMTREFERRVAAIAGVEHCVAVTSGTAAIALALIAVGVGAGGEVIVPDLTFIATANAVKLAGAQPRLVDVEPLRLSIDVDAVARAIGPRTRAVVAVDVNGRGANYSDLEPLCRQHGLRLITDSAEGLGSRFHGRPLGSFGDAGCFSFSPNKLVTTGQGGMVATNDTAIYERLLELKDQGRRIRGTGGDDLHPVLGFNFKFTDLQAAVGLAQLDQLGARSQRAVERDAWYRESLVGLAGVVFLDQETAQHGEVRAWADVLVEQRDRVRRALGEASIGHRAFWLPLHTQTPYLAGDAAFPVATRLSSQGLWLPSTFDITRDDVRWVSGIFRAALK